VHHCQNNARAIRWGDRDVQRGDVLVDLRGKEEGKSAAKLRAHLKI